MDLNEYQDVFNVIVNSAAVSLPMVVACGLVGKVFNALTSMITGERRVKL